MVQGSRVQGVGLEGFKRSVSHVRVAPPALVLGLIRGQIQGLRGLGA